MSANSEEQSQVFPYTFTGHLCPLQSDICPEKTLCLAAASCSTNTPHCPTVAQLLFFQEKHVYECSSEAALIFGRVTARLKTSGELQHERALAIIHTWDTTSRAQRVDVSCGAANLILRALASLNSTYASPVPQVPVRFGTSVACCPAGELLDGLHVPAFVAELDEGATSASCGFIYTGGEFRIWTDPNFSARYFDAEEATVYHIQAGVLPCYLFGCIVHRTYQEQFFDRLAVHMLKDNFEEETMSTVAQTLGRDQVVTQNLLRIRYVVRNSGQYACLALNVLPIDCPGAMNGESPAATPSALSSVMPPAEFPDPVTQFCVQRAASRLGGGGGGIGEAERLHGCTAEMEEGLLPDGLQFSAIVEPVPVKGVKVPVSCVLVTVDKHMNSELSAKPAGIYDQYANTCTSTGSTCGNRSRRNAASLRGSTSVHDFLNESTLFRGQTGAHVSDAAEIIHYDVSGLISCAPRNDKQACDLDRHEWKLRTSCNNPYQAEDQLLPRLVSDCRKSWKLKCLKKRKQDIGIEQQRSDTKSKSRQKLGNNPSQQDEVHQRKEEERERMQRHYELQYQHLPSKISGDETTETQDSRKPEQAKYQRGHTKCQLSIAGLQKGESSKALSSAKCTTFSSPALSTTYWQKGSPSAQYRHALYPVVLDQAEIDFGAMRLPLSPSSDTMRAHAEESHLSQRYERLNLKILDDNDINLGSCSNGNDGPSTHNECEASQTYLIPSCQTFSTTLTPPKAM